MSTNPMIASDKKEVDLARDDVAPITQGDIQIISFARQKRNWSRKLVILTFNKITVILLTERSSNNISSPSFQFRHSAE
jgi:hypothetical protein